MLMLRRAWLVLATFVPAALSGCAAAYHDYPDRCIPYAYCPPPPLPFTTYAPCGCPTPIAAQYKQRAAADGTAESHYADSPDAAASATAGPQEAPPGAARDLGP